VFSLLILLVLGGALAVAGPGDAQRPEPPAEVARPTASGQLEADRLARISVRSLPGVARGVARVRNLQFGHLPKPEVVSSAFLNRLGARELADHSGNLGIGADNAFGAITGLLQPDEDLHAAYTSTGDLAAAAYDPRTKRLYIVSDAAAPNRALVKFELAHELNHALEDQHFGIGGGGRLDDDAALARQALVEGSATELMIEYARAYLNPLELIAATGTIDEGTGDVPKAFVDQLTWTYLGGRKFIDSLRTTSGDWKLVDYALETRPPQTTEQVLHPSKYLRDELPDPVRINPAPLRTRGWRLADRNVLGELATGKLLEVGADATAATAAARGWDGDRYELWRRGVAPSNCDYPCRSDLALVAKWRFDRMPDALEFERAASAYLTDGLGADDLAGPAWRVDGGYASVATAGDVSAIAFAPTEELARQAAGAQVP
jgi:hypothetical protein